VLAVAPDDPVPWNNLGNTYMGALLGRKGGKGWGKVKRDAALLAGQGTILLVRQ
jgi:hypothetical protein